LQEKIEDDNLKEPANRSRRQTIRNSGNLDRSTKTLNDKAAALISCMTRDHMQPIECIPFHEIVCFKNVDKLQAALCGDPRRRIQLDLLECYNFLKCRITGQPDLYTLAQEHGDLINLHDWAVTELQITGLLRMPSKRRPDFVQRVAFGL
nr:hypothetical protein [Tanacetum cinerariifolium]